MSLVNEAAVDAAIHTEMTPEEFAKLSDQAKADLRAEWARALEAAAPHIGGEAIRQAVAAERLVGVEQAMGGARAHLDTYERALDDVLKHAEGEQ